MYNISERIKIIKEIIFDLYWHDIANRMYLIIVTPILSVMIFGFTHLVGEYFLDSKILLFFSKFVGAIMIGYVAYYCVFDYFRNKYCFKCSKCGCHRLNKESIKGIDKSKLPNVINIMGEEKALLLFGTPWCYRCWLKSRPPSVNFILT